MLDEIESRYDNHEDEFNGIVKYSEDEFCESEMSIIGKRLLDILKWILISDNLY